MTQGLQSLVTVKDLVKDFRPGLGKGTKRVLHGISFEVNEGEIFGFVGPNGAGKTTTLKILMGLIHATSGKASILGHDVSESAYRQHIGFLPENPYFYDYLTGREFLRFYAKLAGTNDKSRMDMLLERVGLAHAADARLRTYSKGMLQRIGIAQALVHDPKVIFLDEPMSGLDPIGRKEIRDLILSLNREGKTVFMNTHILSDVETICDQVAIIVKGRIEYRGRLGDFLAGEDRQTDVVLSSVVPELVDRFQEEFGCEISGLGETIEFRVAEKHLNELLTAALAREVTVHSVTPHRKSLESLFLSAVNRGESGGESE